MTKTTLAALAAAILAGTAFTSAAEAGGVRLGYGFPLGSFVAREHSPDATRSYGHRKVKHHRSARVSAPVRKVLKNKKKINVAEPHKVKAKPQVAEKTVVIKNKVKTVKTAKVEDKTIVSDAPVINVPGTPVAAQPQTTAPAAEKPVETAAVHPEPVVEVIKAEEPKTEQVTESASDADEVAVTERAKQACRRFSALIGKLIDVPCK